MQLHFYLLCAASVSLSFRQTFDTNEYNRCTKLPSVYVLKLRITIEQNALIALQEWVSNRMTGINDYQSAAEAYIKPIIDEVNQEFTVFGIHIRTDYEQIIMENFPFDWDKSKCTSDDTVLKRTEMAKMYFDSTAKYGVGNRLLIFHCQLHESFRQTLSHISNIKKCSNILGIMYHKPEMMKMLIKDEIIKMLSDGVERNEDINYAKLNIELCKYVHNCVSSIDNAVGELVYDQRTIKDVTRSNFFLSYSY